MPLMGIQGGMVFNGDVLRCYSRHPHADQGFMADHMDIFLIFSAAVIGGAAISSSQRLPFNQVLGCGMYWTSLSFQMVLVWMLKEWRILSSSGWSTLSFAKTRLANSLLVFFG